MGRILVVAAVLLAVCPYPRAEGGGPFRPPWRLASVTIGGPPAAPPDKPTEGPPPADTGATPEGTYDLRTRYKVGQVILVRSTMTSDIQFKGELPPELAGALPKDLAKMMKEFMEHGLHFEDKSEVRYTVDEVRDGLAAVARAEIKTAEQTTPADPGQTGAKTVPSPLEGKTIVVTTDAEGRSTYATESGKEVDPKEAAEYCNDLADDLLRGKDLSAVKPGQEWEVSRVVVRSMFQVSDKGEAGATVKFVEVVVRDGRRLARMEFQAHVKDEIAQGAPGMSLDMTGEYLFDLGHHMPYRLTGEGTSRMGGGAGVPGLDLAMEGPMHLKQLFQDVTGK